MDSQALMDAIPVAAERVAALPKTLKTVAHFTKALEAMCAVEVLLKALDATRGTLRDDLEAAMLKAGADNLRVEGGTATVATRVSVSLRDEAAAMMALEERGLDHEYIDREPRVRPEMTADARVVMELAKTLPEAIDASPHLTQSFRSLAEKLGKEGEEFPGTELTVKRYLSLRLKRS